MAVRPIDGDELLGITRLLDTDAVRQSKTASWLLDQVLHDIQAMPTLTPSNEWVSVEERLPELPDRDWCSIMVITAQKNNPKSRPMIYERAVVRGKRVERWKYYWDRIADELPDYWRPLPAPPDRRPPEGKEDT